MGLLDLPPKGFACAPNRLDRSVDLRVEHIRATSFTLIDQSNPSKMTSSANMCQVKLETWMASISRASCQILVKL